ncbi:protein RRP6-like 3 isoform X2 [Malania oleifera]|uniref:protein RRP6-like 3 isoform X2 n=1 Tax=Malania oleifera TaxID=397392 RepID=UPI0025ADA543|nr:protein RRP6-like 3 isoform X2 [Malania oleifera]
MENRAKIKIAFAIACFAAISILVAAQKRKRRKQKQSPTSCYLKTELKPQHAFKCVLADNSYSPFKHFKLRDFKDEICSNSHPYEAEILSLLENPRLNFSFVDGRIYLEKSESYVWVDTKTRLQELADSLSREKIFAVDTEQHSLRSFLGFTALMQVSTQNEDYLVDTIALHDSMGVLRPVFSDPNICKVFHGADNDILWLQRDFYIYVVNLFDTAKACEVLSKPQKSLAYLLETYSGVITNKLLQREDWRQRPLSAEMVQYACTDAHYLLYIADCLTAELKQRDNENTASPDEKFHFVLEASRRSNMICLQLYAKEIEAYPGESSVSSIFSRHLSGQGGASSKYCETQFQDNIRRLCAWRDLMARLHDESLRYVLSDQAIVALADIVPMTQTEICDTITQADQNVDSLTFILSFPSPSPVIYSHMEDLCNLLQDETGCLDGFFLMILQKHMGPNGSCPLSIYNYALLSKSNIKMTNILVSKKNVAKNYKRNSRKASRELFVKKFSCKSPVYHNCRIYASDGRLLCYCDRRKLEWYLRRDLAKLVDDSPPAIVLLFEPKGRPEDEDNDFYIQIAHSAAEKYKKQIAAEFGIPLFVRKVVDSKQAPVISESSAPMLSQEEEGVSPLQLRTAAMALLRHGRRMPPERHEELTQIVGKYYGGREIAEDDLKNALLVGMSPHERRRMKKKRGLSFKYTTGSTLPHEGQESNTSMVLYTVPDSVKLDTADELQNNTGEAFIKNENRSPSMVVDTDVSNPSMCSSSEVYAQVLSCSNKDTNSDQNEVFQTQEVCSLIDDDNYESRSLSNGTVESYCSGSRTDGIVSSKHNSKLSLLGHGPHGKQVVDHLLKEYGENGITQFCQRWRQVFVEAIHPQFLPAGWDVKHSGRREFGEFSVYNPANKAVADAGAKG